MQKSAIEKSSFFQSLLRKYLIEKFPHPKGENCKMKLNIKKRVGATKSELYQVRREGNIPAVLYSTGKTGEKITIEGVEFKAILRKLTPGRLSTTQFVLVDGSQEHSVIVKEIQYHPTTYEILHIDFMVLAGKVRVRVPVECVGVADCQGIKLGGFLRQVIRYAKVECSANAIPAAFSVDIRDLAIGDVKRLSDVEIPAGIRSLGKMNEVVVVIAKR